MAQTMDTATVVDRPLPAVFPVRKMKGSWVTFGQRAFLSLLAAGIVYLTIGIALSTIVTR